MTNHSKMRLGKRPRRDDPRTLKLARYLLPGAYAAAIAPPSNCDYTRGVKLWGMMLNDKLSCCTISAAGHAVQVWTSNTSKEITVPDSTILSYYERWDGYNPQDASTDQGGVELDVLNDWRQQGFNGHSLDAYVAIDLGHSQIVANRAIGSSGHRAIGFEKEQIGNRAMKESTDEPMNRSTDGSISQLATALWLFGGAYLGVQLPLAAQNQEVWDVPQNPGPNDEPGSWGGHAIYLVGYDTGNREQGTGNRGQGIGNREQGIEGKAEKPVSSPQSPIFTCITWGKLKCLTWAWLERYCDEAYALVSKDWIKANGIAPSGFDFATLEADLKLVTG